MKIRAKCEVITIFLLCVAILFSYSAFCLKLAVKQESQNAQQVQSTQSAQGTKQKKYIKWMTFDVPTSALSKAMKLDIKSHEGSQTLNWIEILAYLATKYGGNWKQYKSKDMDALAEKLKSGSSMSELTANMKHYSYFYKAYDAVLHGFLGEYKAASTSGDGSLKITYGLKVYSPIACGYYYGHYDDFGNSRSFGFARRHLGNDLMGSIGTPIIAVESGVVESLGWNRYGGWRIGIRSSDRKRYYYYAHLRKNHPYVLNLKQGMLVKAGEVIGYLGMTGYSNEENVNNMKKPHLHFGMQIIFDESQKESNNEIWIDVYDIVNILYQNRSAVKKDTITGDYYSTTVGQLVN